MAMSGHHHHLPSYLAAATAAAALFLAFAFAPLAAGDPLGQFCGNSGNYTTNSTYHGNIQRLAATLPKNTSSSPTLFATAAVGAVPDTVYALALCRGDTNASACEDCVAAAFQDTQKLCAYNKDAAVFYDPCLLRYSNQNLPSYMIGEFFVLMHTRNVSTTSSKNYVAVVAELSGGGSGRGGSVLILMNTQNVTAPFKVFDTAVGALVNATANYAASNSSKRFGTGVEAFQNFDGKNPRIYALAQCMPDMTPVDCRSCLSDLTQLAPKYFSGKQGGRVLGSWCNYRYEQYSFTSTPLLQLPEPAVGDRRPRPRR